MSSIFQIIFVRKNIFFYFFYLFFPLPAVDWMPVRVILQSKKMNCIQRFFDRIPEWKLLLITAVFAALTAFYCLSGRILLSGDETRVAGIIRELQFSPNPFFLPRLNGVPFLEYPPLYYWGGAFFISVFGVSYGTIKAMSALSFGLSILLTFGLARKLKLDKAAAFFSAVMLGLAFSYFSTGRNCMVDSTLGFFVLLAVFGFYSGMAASNWKTALFYYIVYAAGAGCAVMTKGLLGLALPGVILFFTLLFWDIAESKLHWKLWLILGFASLAALVPVAWWAYKVYLWLINLDGILLALFLLLEIALQALHNHHLFTFQRKLNTGVLFCISLV